MLRLVADLISHYRILERIGTGGMGTVYRAQDEQTGATVALKTLHPHLAADPEYVRRFEREARIAESIDSPDVVKVIDAGHDGDSFYIVMELVPGETLAEVIQRRGRLPVNEAVSIAAAIARVGTMLCVANGSFARNRRRLLRPLPVRSPSALAA